MKRTSNPIYSKIGNRIANLRRREKLTQAQLAEKIDITVKHLSESERGLTCLSLEKLIMLCDILNTDMEYLIRGNDITAHSVDIPPYIMHFLSSEDPKHRKLIQDYFQMFIRIRNK